MTVRLQNKGFSLAGRNKRLKGITTGRLGIRWAHVGANEKQRFWALGFDIAGYDKKPSKETQQHRLVKQVQTAPFPQRTNGQAFMYVS